MRKSMAKQNVNGSNGKYNGRPSLCDNEPGWTACLKRSRSSKNSLCRICLAEGARKARVTALKGKMI